MVYLTRKEHFNAAHKLFNPQWSQEKNLEVFGKCANPNWHGHNYKLFITLKGEPNPDTGYLYDAKKLSSIIKENVLDQLDHKNLNLDVDFMQGKICTTENLAMGIWNQISPHIEGAELYSVKLYETENIFVEYFGN